MTRPAEHWHILLVDDDPVDRKVFCRMVLQQKLPYDVQEVASCQEARDVLGTKPFDLALMDYELVDGTGVDLLPDFLAAGVPVVMLTGAGTEEIAARSMRVGASDYIIKDGEGQYLRTIPMTIKNVIARSRAEKERDRLLVELKQAVDTIQNLRGLLPICATCKKIRNDRGYWQSVESYVTEHSQAEFTHSICPECHNMYVAELES